MGEYATVIMDLPFELKTNQSLPMNWASLGTLTNKMPYDTMTMDEIRNFDINKYAAKDSLLFMWASAGKLKEKDTPILKFVFELLELWGFSYHTTLTWVKTKPHCIFSPINWKSEHLIFGYRGDFKKLVRKKYGVMSSVFYGDNKRHSEKPATIYQKLMSWTPPPRIDLFARRAHRGFHGMGNQYEGNIDEGTLLEFLEPGTG